MQLWNRHKNDIDNFNTAIATAFLRALITVSSPFSVILCYRQIW